MTKMPYNYPIQQGNQVILPFLALNKLMVASNGHYFPSARLQALDKRDGSAFTVQV